MMLPRWAFTESVMPISQESEFWNMASEGFSVHVAHVCWLTVGIFESTPSGRCH